MTKPFNLADAKAGHPVACVEGGVACPIRILATDLAGDQPIAFAYDTIKNRQKVATAWPDGTVGMEAGFKGKEAPYLAMIPVANISGRDIYPGDKLTHRSGREITITAGMQILADDYIIYPETRMTPDAMVAAFNTAAPGSWDSFIAVANAVIRHGIDNGYLLAADGDVDLGHKFVRSLLQEVATGCGMTAPYSYADIPAAVRRREVAIAQHFYQVCAKHFGCATPPMPLDIVNKELTKV